MSRLACAICARIASFTTGHDRDLGIGLCTDCWEIWQVWVEANEPRPTDASIADYVRLQDQLVEAATLSRKFRP